MQPPSFVVKGEFYFSHFSSRGYAAESASIALQRDTSKVIHLLLYSCELEQTTCDVRIGWPGTRLVHGILCMWHVRGLDGEFASIKPLQIWILK